MPLASFTRRAAAFVIDFLIAWLLFLAILIPGGRLAHQMGLLTGDVNLRFDFGHWYSLLFLVVLLRAFDVLGEWPNDRQTVVGYPYCHSGSK